VPTKGFRDETLNFSYAEILGLASLRCFATQRAFASKLAAGLLR